MSLGSPPDPTPDGDVRGFSLVRDDHGALGLVCTDRPDWKPLQIDWSSPEMRSRIAAGRKQPLARAVGIYRHGAQTLLDTTAGLGSDGFTLAALGAEVRLIERQGLVVELLRDAQRRALASDDRVLREAAGRVRIEHADARSLPEAWLAVDVAYMDPMYDNSRRRALPQKSMQMLRQLAGDDLDAEDLLRRLRRWVPRVVVKRPDRAPPLGDQAPNACFKSSQARFDVYLKP